MGAAGEVHQAQLGTSENFAASLLDIAQAVVIDQLFELVFFVESIAVR